MASDFVHGRCQIDHDKAEGRLFARRADNPIFEIHTPNIEFNVFSFIKVLSKHNIFTKNMIIKSEKSYNIYQKLGNDLEALCRFSFCLPMVLRKPSLLSP